MNKKQIYIILGTLVLVGTLVFLFFPTSATCKYKGTPDLCTLEARTIPMWKLLLFELAGISTGYGYF